MKLLKRHFVLAAFAATMFSACAPDDDNVELDERDKFTGSWTCRDTSYTDASLRTYGVTVEKSGEGNQILLRNFYQLGSSNSVTAEVSGNSIVVPSQVVDDYTINGSGVFSGQKFSITYSATLGSATDNGKAQYE